MFVSVPLVLICRALFPPPPLFFFVQHTSQRIRSGSISGRLRSASELEEKGLIDRMQKGALKNLIMSGDEELLSALDKFTVEGDSAELHALLKSGALEGAPGLDLDLLMDDLDLNFLQLTSGGGGGGQAGHAGAEVENYQFDMDDMASFIVGDPSAGSAGAGSFVEDDLLAGLDRVSGVLGRSMSPGQGGTGFGLSPFGEDGGLPAFLVSVKEEVAAPSIVDRSKPAGPGRAKVIKRELSIKNKPPSAVSSAAKGIDIPKSKKVGSSVANVAATVGAAMANKNQAVGGAAKGNSTHGGKTSPVASGAAGASAIGASSSSSSASSSMAASLLMPVPSSLSSPASAGAGVAKEPGAAGGSGTGPVFGADKDANKHYIGAYSPESRRLRLEKFWDKKKNRIWDRKVKYDVRKNFADSRVRVKGRFVKKEDEAILMEVNTLTSKEGALDSTASSSSAPPTPTAMESGSEGTPTAPQVKLEDLSGDANDPQPDDPSPAQPPPPPQQQQEGNPDDLLASLED